MNNRFVKLGAAMALASAMCFADFRYDQTSKMTGGAMMGMMRMAAKFNKNAMIPTDSTVSVKGNHMVTNNAGKSATVYDLDQGTITEINFEKREYSVTTFAEMKAFLEKTMKDAGQQDTNISVDVQKTGKTQTVEGMKAEELLMTMTVTTNNPQTGKPAEMRMVMSNWMAPKIRGYEEVAAFYKRMAEKFALNGVFGAGPQAGMGKGMAEAAKEMEKMGGIPVMQIIRMIPTDPEQVKQMEQLQQSAEAMGNVEAPKAGDVASDAAGQAAAGAVAGRLGRLGGLGGLGGGGGFGGLRRKKKQEEPAPEPTPAAAAAPETPAIETSLPSEPSLMEMTVTLKNFSNSPVSDSDFAAPQGFKLVKSAMQR